ncbi:MAG TPA: glycolate oxidase subunit GlcE [Rhizomicrobium sp.]|nr:glycolate oxidase subunit GlcE [Rhizomicrobium sp.]
MADFSPASAEDIADIVKAAAANREPLEVLGNGTKRGIGRPMTTPHRLSTARLDGITLYEPEELILSAKAGTPLSQIETLLAEHNQQLAFEPPHRGAQTIGGVIAAGFSGPRRIQAGAIRDHLLGFTAVNGSGEIFKAGGRVVKNVTGYDLSKLMAGSFGTLAVLSEVTLKVLPKPEARTTLIRRNQSARDTIKLLNKALGLPFDITGAAWSPDFNGITALRLEGFADSVADRANTLSKFLDAEVAGADFDNFWDQMRDISPLENATALWRVCVPPNRGADILEALPGARTLVDWGGGLVWLGTTDENDCGASALRTAVRETGGHATLIRASDETRLRIAPFQSQSAALFALTARVKESFDPLHILSPGRMYANL